MKNPFKKDSWSITDKEPKDSDNLTEQQKMILEVLFDAGQDNNGKSITLTADQILDEINKKIRRKQYDRR